MPSLSKMLPLLALALMLIRDACAAPANFFFRNTLKNAVNACLALSDVGNCCALKDMEIYANIVLAAGDDQDGECEDGYTHLQNWENWSLLGQQHCQQGRYVRGCQREWLDDLLRVLPRRDIFK